MKEISGKGGQKELQTREYVPAGPVRPVLDVHHQILARLQNIDEQIAKLLLALVTRP